MGVVYIGDRAVGKTHLAMELANPQSDYVKVSSPDYENLRTLLFDEDLGGTTGQTHLNFPIGLKVCYKSSINHKFYR